VHAVRVLSARKDFDIDSLIAAGYDTLLTEFEVLIPELLKAFDAAPVSHPLKAKLAEPIAALRAWDNRWSVVSIPTSLAVFWGEELWQRVGGAAREAGVSVYRFMAERASAEQRLQALAAACDKLTADFGSWKTPWGEINRFQRLTGDIAPSFDDGAPSVPVGFTSARWGSLASFGARAHPGTKKWYGTSGNSFVAAVEFGPRVRARAVMAGGQSGDAASPFFKDQAERYASGLLRDVYFYRDQLQGHITRQYRPGE
jgi:acyl-homoserine-lactone acylase